MGFLNKARILASLSMVSLAAFSAAEPSAKPDIRIGVVSDVHMRNEPGFDATFLKALRWFDCEKTDIVIVPGDLTDQAMNSQLEHFMRCWRDVFPDDRRSDGGKVERLFITGNHDDEGAIYAAATCNGFAPSTLAKTLERPGIKPQSLVYGITNAIAKARHAVMANIPSDKSADVLAEMDDFEAKVVAATNLADIAALVGEAGTLQTNATALFYAENFATNMPVVWKRVFNEEWGLFLHKRVKGYDFIGVNWQFSAHVYNAQKLRRFIESLDLPPDRPFFYVQHPHPRGTCHGPNVWGQDSGYSTNVLSGFPNAILLSGHSHTMLTDERAIWQGAFTSIGCASIYYLDKPPGTQITPQKMEGGAHGLLIEVFGDRIAVHRHDFFNDEPLGPDWSFPAVWREGEPRPYSPEARAAVVETPQFSQDARLQVNTSGQKDFRHGRPWRIAVSVPLFAVGKGYNNLAEMEFSLVKVADSGKSDVIGTKRVLPGKSYWSRSHWEGAFTAEFTFHAFRDLEDGTVLRVTARPCNAFGGKGDAMISENLVLGGTTASMP